MFETCAKQLVLVTLNQKVVTEFFNGTLFVRTITAEQADSVFQALTKSIGNVQVSPIGNTGEYAYDFI